MLWARRFGFGTIEFNRSLVLAVGGATTQDVVDNQLADAIASGADSAVVMVGVNDNGASIATGTSTANIDTIASTLAAAGIHVFFCDDSPATGESGAALTQHVAIRDHIRSLAGATVVPTWNAICANPDDTAPGTGMEDTVHYGPHGALRAGMAVAEKMLAVLPPTNWFNRASVIAGGDYSGTSGTKTGVTGSVPNGWTVALESGSGTVVASIDAADGLNWLTVTLTGGSAPVIGVYSDDISGGVTAGTDYLDMVARCRVDPGTVGVISCQMVARRDGDTALQTTDAIEAADGAIINSTTNTIASCGMELAFSLPHILFPAGATQLKQRFEIRGLSGVTSSGVFRFAIPQFRLYTGSLTD